MSYQQEIVEGYFLAHPEYAFTCTRWYTVCRKTAPVNIFP